MDANNTDSNAVPEKKEVETDTVMKVTEQDAFEAPGIDDLLDALKIINDSKSHSLVPFSFKQFKLEPEEICQNWDAILKGVCPWKREIMSKEVLIPMNWSAKDGILTLQLDPVSDVAILMMKKMVGMIERCFKKELSALPRGLQLRRNLGTRIRAWPSALAVGLSTSKVVNSWVSFPLGFNFSLDQSCPLMLTVMSCQESIDYLEHSAKMAIESTSNAVRVVVGLIFPSEANEFALEVRVWKKGFDFGPGTYDHVVCYEALDMRLRLSVKSCSNPNWKLRLSARDFFGAESLIRMRSIFPGFGSDLDGSRPAIALHELLDMFSSAASADDKLGSWHLGELAHRFFSTAVASRDTMNQGRQELQTPIIDRSWH